MNVVDAIARRGYRFKGTATIHEDGEVYERGLELLRERDYAAYEERVRAIVLIRVERAEPLTSPAYDLGTNEDELPRDVRGVLPRREPPQPRGEVTLGGSGLASSPPMSFGSARRLYSRPQRARRRTMTEQTTDRSPSPPRGEREG